LEKENILGADFEDFETAPTWGRGKIGYSLNNCHRCSGCEGEGERDTI
jgi:hypothetical protein